MAHEGALRTVDEFLGRWHALPAKERYQLIPEVPVAALQVGALTHPNPWARRGCLHFLDHYANDESVDTFLAALDDPVTPVRELALHGLACERCRSTELCVADVLPVLSRVIESDPSPDVRHKAIPILLRLAASDPRASQAIQRAAQTDQDVLIRQVAVAALEGRGRDALRARNDLQRQARSGKAKRDSRSSTSAGPIAAATCCSTTKAQAPRKAVTSHVR